jgi:hypothetical protein
LHPIIVEQAPQFRPVAQACRGTPEILTGVKMLNQVVAHFLDGQLVKGTSLDVQPPKPDCHIRTTDRGMVEVRLADLKALFFVKSLVGNPEHQYATEPDPGDSRLAGSHRISITFADGERLVGLTNRHPPLGRYFWVLPVDAASNTMRILVNRAAVKEMEGE